MSYNEAYEAEMTEREAAARQYQWICTDCLLCGHSVIAPETTETLSATGRFRCVACGIVVESVPREAAMVGGMERQ